MFLSLKTLYRKRTVIWPFYFYTIIRTLSEYGYEVLKMYADNKTINRDKLHLDIYLFKS
ncbi:hypothetical protein DQU93_08815 [Staphylococcus aureus]|nr:hypothetical protein DQU93_08815 [Staphylococcus aureus]